MEDKPNRACGFEGQQGLIAGASQDFPGGSDGKASACNVGDQGLIPASSLAVLCFKLAGQLQLILYLDRIEEFLPKYLLPKSSLILRVPLNLDFSTSVADEVSSHGRN